MPSHIYTRVGYWKESVASNLAAASAAQAHKESSDLLHAQDYVVYAYLQLAQDDKARAMIANVAAVEGVNPAVQAPHFARAASPARYVIERGDWTGAMALEVKPSRFAFIDAITHFARALGAARAGQPAAAKADIAKLVEFRDSLRKANNAYWAEQVDIQWQVASAWVLFAEGKHDEALRMMSAAADVEDKTEKSPVTPGPIAPARELYGYMLLERGMAREALNAFESTQQKEPNRYHGYAGAAQAADRLGDKTKAKANYEKLIALAGDTFVLASDAGVARPELIAARKYLASN
jgi:tetratricopeptide (TPR) repeat protein